MAKSDEENLVLVASTNVDEVNAKFYCRFPFPWRPIKFDYVLDPDLETVMLNQNLGDWQHSLVPKQAKIWVAGCGTNQAVFTALRFPQATITGSDLSTESLKLSAQTAKELGISNLKLKQESINQVDYKEQFDYIICTGVIMVNADPKATLDKLAAALKPTGILELMVYNRYHRITTSAFQKAIRILGGNTTAINFESELSITQKIINAFPAKNLMSNLLDSQRTVPETALADALLQPVEYSYTVESLEELATSCGLELVTPCLNQFDKAQRTFAWNMEFKDSQLQSLYEALPDSRRWQVSNLLLLEQSPLLWFYLQRQDSGRPRKSEKQMCAEFLDTNFIKIESLQRSYVQAENGNYSLSPDSVPFPLAPPDVQVKDIFDAIDGKSSMRDIFQRLGLQMTFSTVNQVRLQLTTSAFPYLRAVSTAADDENANGQQQLLAAQKSRTNIPNLKTVKRKAVYTEGGVRKDTN
jgi:2-polyprenyl-3-methyl-5-hydroxy-6-metoxy-1,4-benzoquinol methylase